MVAGKHPYHQKGRKSEKVYFCPHKKNQLEVVVWVQHSSLHALSLQALRRYSRREQALSPAQCGVGSCH
jgi:hypothetical protein